MLVEIAIGDAYGAGFEYVKPRIVAERNTLAAYVQHPRHAIAPGRYTDDTQMSIAVAEALVSGAPFSRELLADRFVQAFKRDPREGYAAGFFAFLSQVSDGADFLATIKPDSYKSGAAMRAAPLGIIADVPELIEKTKLQARITHDTPDGVNAAVAAALATHFCLYELGGLEELGPFVSAHVAGQWEVPWVGEVGPKGWMSTRAAITALSRATRMSELLKECVAFTGDVDTVAAIAMGAGSCCAAIEQDLPAQLIEGLENGPWGRRFLEDLDRQFMAMIGR